MRRRVNDAAALEPERVAMASLILTWACLPQEPYDRDAWRLTPLGGLGRPGLGLALVANADAESLLDPFAVWGVAPWGGIPGGTGAEDSAGLFMLNARGLGHGLTLEERQHPLVNIHRFIHGADREGSPGLLEAPIVLAAYDAGATPAELAALVCVHVERPADAARKGKQRADRCRQWFPVLSERPARDITAEQVVRVIIPRLWRRVGVQLW